MTIYIATVDRWPGLLLQTILCQPSEPMKSNDRACGATRGIIKAACGAKLLPTSTYWLVLWYWATVAVSATTEQTAWLPVSFGSCSPQPPSSPTSVCPSLTCNSCDIPGIFQKFLKIQQFQLVVSYICSYKAKYIEILAIPTS